MINYADVQCEDEIYKRSYTELRKSGNNLQDVSVKGTTAISATYQKRLNIL